MFKVLDKIQTVYLAGVVDSDGCISISKNKKGLTPYLRIGNTDRRMLEWMQKNIANNKITHVKKDPITKRKDYYQWQVCGDRLVYVLKCILPYLQLKKEQALIVLEFLKTRTHRNRLGEAPPYLKKNREELFIKIKELNKIGRKSSKIICQEVKFEKDQLMLNIQTTTQHLKGD